MYYSRWRQGGPPDESNSGLTILDLINLGTLDARLAALLWQLMEKRASVLVAAGPSNVGKSTLLNCLLDFLPPSIEQVLLEGDYEDFKFAESRDPAKTYMIAEEIGVWGYAEYIKGVQAVRTFELLPRGFGLGATIHGRNSQEVVYVLHRMIGVPLDLIGDLGVIVTLSVRAGANWNDEPLRRLNAVDAIFRRDEGLAVQTLAAYRSAEKRAELLPEKALQEALEKKGLGGKTNLKAAIDAKAEFLAGLLIKGLQSRAEVRNAVRGFYSTGRGAG